MSYIQREIVGHAGHIMLDRPKALNAMTIEMVTEMTQILKSWAKDEAVHHVIITSSSERAFCAGGDVREAVSVIKDNPEQGSEPYFKAEYGFDMCLATFPKPVTSLVSGVVMGGGLGVARLSDFMVITPDIKLAMPETAIGLFPDVGASYFLTRAPFHAALMMGMTGTMIGAGDAIKWQIADAVCAGARMDELFQALSKCRSRDEIHACLADVNDSPPDASLAHKMDDIEAIFGHKSLAGIAQAARDYAAKGGHAGWHEALSHKCPLSIACFWHMMQAPCASVTDAILRDYHLARKMTARPDFIEGVRAVLIDKDNDPKWSPRQLADISEEMLAELFDFANMTPLPEQGFMPKTHIS